MNAEEQLLWDIFSNPHEKEESMTIETNKYARRPFYVDAVQVTEENMEEVAKWCQGDVATDPKALTAPEASGDDHPYVKVRVHRPLTERQTKAFVGDWVLYAGTGFKVYTPKAFEKSFERVSDDVSRVVHRSAVDGQFVSAEDAEENPDTTVADTVED